jgi:hypothetical protein
LNISYDPEGGPVSTAPAADNIQILNLVGGSDEVTVTGILAGDIVKVYKGDLQLNTTTSTETSVKIILDSDLAPLQERLM